jgi:branched-chain amino acid transport system permease protein
MQGFVEQVLTGLANGSLIAVIALGYTLVYGIVELINFAHGDVFMMGCFMALTVVLALGTTAASSPAGVVAGILAALLASMLFCAVINTLIDQVAYRRLREAPRLVPLITAIGMSFILMNLGGFWKGWAPVTFPDILPDINLLEPLGINFRFNQLFVILVTVPLLVALQFFVYRTRLGKAMRATAQNADAARLMGIDTNRTIATAFFLGGLLAGAAGLVYGLYNEQGYFQLGFRQGLNAFTAAVLGGIGNMAGAVLGGLIIGIVEALTAYYLAQALGPAAVFAALILIILFKPSGLLGENVPEKV